MHTQITPDKNGLVRLLAHWPRNKRNLPQPTNKVEDYVVHLGGGRYAKVKQFIDYAESKGCGVLFHQSQRCSGHIVIGRHGTPLHKPDGDYQHLTRRHFLAVA